jgi:chaperonin GroEL
VLAIKAPGFGDRRKAMLEDIATLTRRVISKRSAASRQRSARGPRAGTSRHLRKDTTTIVGGKGDARRSSTQVPDQASDRRHHPSTRPLEAPGALAKLSGGVATEGRRSHRVELRRKAPHRGCASAARAGVEREWSPGGARPPPRHPSWLDKVRGRSVTKRRVLTSCVALEEPLRQIAANGGGRIGRRRGRSQDQAATAGTPEGQYTDMFVAGIIDPTKVAARRSRTPLRWRGPALTTETSSPICPRREGADARHERRRDGRLLTHLASWRARHRAGAFSVYRPQSGADVHDFRSPSDVLTLRNSRPPNEPQREAVSVQSAARCSSWPEKWARARHGCWGIAPPLSRRDVAE